MIVYDCFKICKCEEPDFNDKLLNGDHEACIHCDVCGGVPENE